jgi:hypothetical protein
MVAPAGSAGPEQCRERILPCAEVRCGTVTNQGYAAIRSNARAVIDAASAALITLSSLLSVMLTSAMKREWRDVAPLASISSCSRRTGVAASAMARSSVIASHRLGAGSIAGADTVLEAFVMMRLSSWWG